MLGGTNVGGAIFKLTTTEERGLGELLCFAIAGSYIQAWFTAPEAVSAPQNDFQSLQR